MARLVDDEGNLLKDGDMTCRGICDKHTFCCDCPLREALKKLAKYEREEASKAKERKEDVYEGK